MRKFSITAIAVASAGLLALAGTAQAAGTTHVLTIGKAKGTAVKPGAILKTGLIKGTSIVFSLKGDTLSCKSSNLVAVVGTNPKAKGTAVELLKSQTFGGCTIKVKGIGGLSVKSLKALNTPYIVAVSDAKGNPVKVTGRSKKLPLTFAVVVDFLGKPFSCTYTAKLLSGSASNKANGISITNQKFTFSSGDKALCPASANVTAFFGPVKDTSVKGDPKVFVN
jgi:hypothetical protein